jgi:hypothetical protein
MYALLSLLFSFLLFISPLRLFFVVPFGIRLRYYCTSDEISLAIIEDWDDDSGRREH